MDGAISHAAGGEDRQGQAMGRAGLVNHKAGDACVFRKRLGALTMRQRRGFEVVQTLREVHVRCSRAGAHSWAHWHALHCEKSGG